MKIQETYINLTEGYQWGDSSPYEPFTDHIGQLFKSLQQEYGRCTSKVYVDRKDQSPIAVGWVFQKRMRYADSSEYYLREVWVTLYDQFEPSITKQYHAIDAHI